MRGSCGGKRDEKRRAPLRLRPPKREGRENSERMKFFCFFLFTKRRLPLRLGFDLGAGTGAGLGEAPGEFGMSPAARQLAFINAAHSFTHYCLLILPTAVLAMVLQAGGPFGDDYEVILPLATGGFVLYGLLSLPQGWLAARFGRHRLMTVFFLGAGLSMIATGLAGSPVMLGVGLALIGAFAAISSRP